MKSLYLLFFSFLLVLPLGSSFAAKKAKVVFISGKPSHGRMAHEHRAGNMILADRLNKSGLPVETVLVPHYGYPKDESVFEGASTIVIFCTGHGGHVLNRKLKEFDAMMKKGAGVVMIHWATEAVKGPPGEKFLEWMGGFCDLNWSVNPHWTPSFKTRKHPIWNGIKPFSVNDEWYYHMRFVSKLKGVTPILTDLPPDSTLKRPDGSHSGNKFARAAIAKKQPQHMAWARVRPDGGRGFGFTGGHNHWNWGHDQFRKLVLNAIVWTAKIDVPAAGVRSRPLTVRDLEANQDYKKPGNYNPLRIKRMLGQWNGVASE